VAVGAVYPVMVIAFGEATAPLAILFSLPLAAMVIGGLTLSTALTLIAVPAAFEMLERLLHPESRPKRRGRPSSWCEQSANSG
jgi:multidrug efflux pump subunit AcrB